jgi:hypothetical protein
VLGFVRAPEVREKVGDFDSIRAFLAAVRRRLVWLEVAGSVGYLLAALGGAWLLLALVAAQAPSGLWPIVAAIAALGALAAVVTLRVMPLWRALGDERMAREVGTQAPAIRSDLLSVVQLSRELESGEARSRGPWRSRWPMRSPRTSAG